MGKKGSKKSKPAQKRYVSEDRKDKNKLKRAQRLANKFNSSVKIKIYGKIETVNPK
jgi:hypothetical protein